MSGIASTLSIAKQAILAHQMSIQVAGNNVANVDTPGYTRQALYLEPSLSFPSTAGLIGTGVDAKYISRFYDQFATARLMQETSNSNNVNAQLESIRLVEAAFNEAPGLGLNDLLSQFWDAWQNLADNPELLAARQEVVQQASLITTQFESMYSEINRTKNDIGIRLDDGVETINALTKQIADLNVQITSAESANVKANDLRDKRDVALKQLSELIDVTYFETDIGAYTVLLPDGHPLVEVNEGWQVSWQDDSLQWITYRRNELNEKIEVETTIGTGAELGGKVGGWLEIYNTLDESDPDSFAGQLNSFAYSFIREINQQVSQGVGMQSFSGELIGTEPAKDTAVLSKAVNTAFATESISADIFYINGRSVGEINGGVPVYGLAMAKSYNAANAINEAYTGVKAKLTTLTTGDAVTAMGAGDDGTVLDIRINGIDVSYTVDGVSGPPNDDTTTAGFAGNIVDAINNALGGAGVTIEAVVGDGTNGGDVDSIVLRNTTAGDESRIVIEGIDTASEAMLGLANGIYNADATHNTGELTLFSVDPFTVKAGNDDTWLEHFNWDGGIFIDNDLPNDGQFTYSSEDAFITNSLQGFSFADELATDGGSFDIWIYRGDGSLALGQPVTVSVERLYTLREVSAAINDAIVSAGGIAGTDASGDPIPFLQASVDNGLLKFTPYDATYRFAFANDTSNILQVAGINTLFTGYNAGNISINARVENDLTLLAAGTVNEFGDIFKGDNSNALQVTNIQREENITFRSRPNNTLDGFYNSLVGEIGIMGQNIKRDQEFHEILSNQLTELRDSVSGVSLDEEMANLIKYQHAYSAAAKLISMADEMLVTLLQTV